MKKIIISIITLLLLHGKTDAQINSKLHVQKLVAKPNPTGLQLGFWPNFKRQEGVLKDFGKRTIERIDFHNWATIETKPGVYDWSGVFNNVKRSHIFGATPITAVNISFTNQINKNGKLKIPSFYPARISNEKTREAAKRFLYAYVQQLLNEVGSAILSIDYEIIFNYALYTVKDIDKANEWGSWYVEAAAVARKAAEDLGKGSYLKLIPIVNGNPIKETALVFKGPSYNQWLVNVINASDYLGIDTYYTHNKNDIANPSGTIDIIKFWIDNYASNKDVIVCENGFSTVFEANPNFNSPKKDKLFGTEAEQAAYYKQLFIELQKANATDGIFKNKLRGLMLWSYIDMKAKSEEESSFGIMRKDGNPKPAYQWVKKGFEDMEADGFSSPVKITNAAGTDKFTTQFNEGNDYEFIRIKLPPNITKVSRTIKIRTKHPGCILINANGDWQYDAGSEKTKFEFKINPDVKEVDIYFTNAVLPFVQEVLALDIK